MNTEMFASLMQRELSANGPKGDWHAWKPDQATAWQELDWHMFKLRKAINECDRAKVTEHAADCGNLLMKIAERFGE